MNNYWEHFKTICTHKANVYKLCKKVDIPWRGITHDLSKFSPIEFIESAKYYSGDRSPIENCKRINGVSKAWQHHKGRNTHHWQYWLDNTKDDIVGRLMPFEDCLEMLCDQFAAGMTYKGNDWSIDYQRNWWDSKIDSHSKYMHPVVFKFMNGVYKASLEYFDDNRFIAEIFNYNLLEDYYYDLKERWEDEEYVD
jgi:hypothetical protein